MRGFIVDASYKVAGGKAYVFLYGRTEKGEPFITMHYQQPYFFLRKKDVRKALKVGTFRYEESSLKNFDGEAVVKVVMDIPKGVTVLRDALHKEGIDTYEADIRFAQRFLIDQGLQGGIEFSGESDILGDQVVYQEPEIAPATLVPKLTILSIDIETDPKAKEVYSIALVQGKRTLVLLRSKTKVKGAECYGSEEAMLERFVAVVQDLDPDVITGWNVIDFDLQVLRKRCKDLEVPFILGRTNEATRLFVRPGFFSSSSATVEGRQVVDLLDWIRSTVKLDDYRLETAAQHFLKKGKTESFTDKGAEIQAMYKKFPEKLVWYNLQDAQLVLDIMEKSDVLSLYLKRSMLTGLVLSRVSGSIAAFDSIYLKRLRKRGYVAPSVRQFAVDERIMGGYVMDSKPGFYDNIIILDFKSLYPSLMRTFNIDPLALGKKGITAPNKASFSKDVGIVPEIIQELFDVREEYRKKGDEVGRYAIKILMNSFFGIMASPMCRFYSFEMGNAITSFAQLFIKKTAKLIEEEGYEVIYSDTDSVFVVAGKDPEKLGKRLEKSLNKTISAFVSEKYGVKSFLELEYEKTYTKFLMPQLRGSEKGAKKRYAGLVKGKLEITGMEAVRGDWTPLAKTFQTQLLMKVFQGKEIKPFVQNFLKDLRTGKHDDLLVYKKALRKPLDGYKVSPPHVKAARKLENFQGKVVWYVYTDQGPEPLQKVTGKLDYDHYVQKQLKPLAESILVFFDLNFDEFLSGQRTLFGY